MTHSRQNKIIAQNGLFLYVQLILTTALGLLTSRIVLKNLGASDFGLYSVVAGFIMLFNVLNMSISASTYRFIAYEMGKGKEANLNKIFNISMVLHILIALVIVFFGEIIGLYYIHHYLNVPTDRISDAIFIFHLSVFTVAINVLSVPFRGLITANEKFLARALIETFIALLKFLVAFSLVFFYGDRLRLYAVLMTIVWLVNSGFIVLYCRIKYNNIVAWCLQTDFKKYKEMASFSGWTLFGACAMVGNGQGNAMILNVFFGTLLNASFGIAKQISGLLTTFTYTLGTVVVPQVHKSYSSGDTDRTRQIVFHTTKYTFFLMLLASLPVLLKTQFLLDLWLDEVPEYTAIFIQLIILSILVQALRGGLGTLLQSTGKIKYYQIITGTTLLLSLPVMAFLFKIGFPPYTGIIVYTVAEFINLFSSLLLLKYIISFDVIGFFRFVHLKIIYVVLLLLPLFYIREFFHENLYSFIVLSTCSVLWLIIAIYFVGIEKAERHKVKSFFVNMLKNKYKRKKL
jgi:O-antigen/teichoic acid export membrane protein